MTVFQDLPKGTPPKRGLEHIIELEEGKCPTIVKPYRYNFHQKIEIEKIMQDLLDIGAIIESESTYATPVVLSRKKAASYRMCIDYRALNRITIKNLKP